MDNNQVSAIDWGDVLDALGNTSSWCEFLDIQVNSKVNKSLFSISIEYFTHV